MIASTLQAFLRHEDDVVRTRAVIASAVLPAEPSLAMLRAHLKVETDPDVREAIQDEIERRS